MRFLRSVLCMVAASLPLGAWEAPAQNEMAALLGEEQPAAVLESGLPLPPTAEEARRSAGFRFDLERRAMKQVLVYRTSLAKAERGRISAENNLACAAMARRLGAPAVFCEYLRLLGSNTLSRRRQYEANQALRSLLQDTYGIDTLQMRLISESLSLPTPQHMLFMLQLPSGGMFDMVSVQLPPRERVLADIQLMNSLLRQVDEILRPVKNAAGADAAAHRLKTLLPLWETTRQIRYHAAAVAEQLTPAERMAAQMLDATTARLAQTRRSLHEQKWYGSSTLQTVDELLR